MALNSLDPHLKQLAEPRALTALDRHESLRLKTCEFEVRQEYGFDATQKEPDAFH